MDERRAALARARRVRSRVLRWYRERRRDLPWRRTSDPYAIWVSEVMLQQTRVETAVSYYDRFLRRFPTVADLAAAGEDDVLALWSGLGYYRRARMLREGAMTIMERHGGRVPERTDELRALPGVGRYTAGAIASISFGHPEPVVDGNVERVLGRWFALRTRPRSRLDRESWELAAALVPRRAAADWNQALMELGATVCAPRAPRCPSCPARTACAGFASGRPESFPPPKPSPSVSDVRVAVALCVSDGRVLLERRPPQSPFRGTWDLPARELPAAADAAARLADTLPQGLGSEPRQPVLVSRASHTILRRRLRLETWRFEFPHRRSPGTAWRWVRPEDVDAVPVSGATRKILRAAASRTQDRFQGTVPSTGSRGSKGSGSGSSGRRKA